MIKATDFQPDWISPPGETIADILLERKLSFEIFARHMNFSDDSIQELLSGQATITLDVAHKLSQVVGASAAFWMNREELYRQDLKRLDNKNIIEQSKIWLQEFPLRDMVKFGWIDKKSNLDEKLETCFKFFGISSIEQWNSRYDRTLRAVAFRTSFAFESKPKSVAAWLRQGELLCHSIKCASWNADKFRQSLSEIRNLTRKKDPAIFVPELQKICAESGVAVAIVRAPSGCRASGATRFISNDKAMLLLSFRYRTDDHFWFSFFHEAAHVLLHGQKGLFIEDADIVRTEEEEEADRFASDIILSTEMRAELSSVPPRFKDVMRFARKAGISHGIVVGQMQHSGLIRREQLNFLKQRFVWEKS